MSEYANQNTAPIVIKKYANRRLYDTSRSTYIVLSDVIELVKAGQEFVIEDAKTGEDLTRSILNQIIFEQETRPQEFLFPLEFQKQLIRMYGDSYEQLVPEYLTRSINYFVEERGQMAQAWQDMMAQGAENFMRQSEAMARQNMEMFRKSWDMFAMMGNQQDGAEPTGPDDEKQQKMRDLQEQIDALQDELKSLK